MVENNSLSKEDFYKNIYEGCITLSTTDIEVEKNGDETIIHIQDSAYKSRMGEV